MAEFKTQSAGLKKYTYNPESDNLFSGTWNLNNENLDKYDPFISGYSFIVWTKLPAFFDADFDTKFRGMTEKNFKTFSGIGDITMTVDDITHGFTGNAYGAATNIQKENTSFSITHQELAGSPIRELYTYWVTGIRDFETGLATYHGKIGSKPTNGTSGALDANGNLVYSAKNHTGELLYVQTDPAGGYKGTGIEFACYYTNVMPTKVPMEHLNYQSGEHSFVEITQDFRGNFHMSEDINELAVNYMTKHHITRGFDEYKTDYSVDGIGAATPFDPKFKRDSDSTKK